jgi:hypothetical protein
MEAGRKGRTYRNLIQNPFLRRTRSCKENIDPFAAVKSNRNIQK